MGREDGIYRPEDVGGFDYTRDLGEPGTFPYTRGPHPEMYRKRLWTMRQFAGFGTAEETNKRFKYLLSRGQTGLSVAFDLPTLYGYDSINPDYWYETGREGVAIDSLRDMAILLDGIPLDGVINKEPISVSMTINSPAAPIWAMFLAHAEARGVAWNTLRGTIQNDILKEYIAQKEYIYPPAPSMRLVVDTIEFATRYVSQWNPVSISGYHIREAGATAVQELAFTLADGIAYVEACIAHGMDVDSFAGRLSFFWDIHNNFFEEIAKLRAARRMWARIMRERFGAKNPKSWMLRTHSQTAGVSLAPKELENNIVRVSLQALAAVLGGTQSLHTNSMDEVWGLPTERAVHTALRTQQIIAHETGVSEIVDPLAGSYFVESLTDTMERGASAYIKTIDTIGGMMRAIEIGYPQKEIADAAYAYKQAEDAGKNMVVGVNALVLPEKEAKDATLILKVDAKRAHEVQKARLEEIRRTRNNERVRYALDAIRRAAQNERDNLMPHFIEAAKAYATLQEMCDVLREEWGEYRENERI
ncbi:MAG: methylmalonyl-CoA mutase family protein [bacterium]|nr:methylmalonyl-CoA mutase family protein [bacterium]